MHEVTLTRRVNHDATKVWALLDDFANAYIYHPVVGKSYATNGQEKGLGAERACQLYSGGAVEERVIEHDPQNMRYRVEVIDHGPFPTKEMFATIHVEAEGAGVSRVTMEMAFTLKYGPIGWLMGATIMRIKMKGLLAQMLEGASQHLQTGRIIEENGALGEAFQPGMIATS